MDLVIPEGVLAVKACMFSGLARSITSVVIPASMTKIGAYAFDDCAELVKVTIPDSLQSIGEYAFSGTNLLQIEIPDSVKIVSL